MTTILVEDEQKIDSTSWKEALNIIKNNGLVVLPTETVYGLAANALSDEACSKIYQAKSRPSDNPFIVHVASINQAEQYVKKLPETARHLFEIFSPGPLTIVLEKKSIISDVASAGLDTIGIRIPSHPLALAFLKECNLPLAAPSANLSGHLSPTTFTMAKEAMFGRVDAIIDGGDCSFGLESTVVSCINDEVSLLREGSITSQQLSNALSGKVIINATKPGISEIVLSPGQKYRHYKTHTPLFLIELNDNILLLSKKLANKKIAFLLNIDFDSKINNFKSDKNFYFTFDNLPNYALNLYKVLSQVDQNDYDLIVAFYPSYSEDGRAICDRLYRSSGGNFLREMEL